MIEEAEKILYIVCPYYKISEEHLIVLKEACDKGVDIHLIYSKADLKHSEIKKLKNLNRLHIYYIPFYMLNVTLMNQK